ncbi:cytidine deaminase [Candidatus Uhrbacteria bacterium RIFCSPLOWO2_02_FULL_48_12]|uniref:Cytidine deaminase n=1 Tax=Candidatus Uhrbacteria bacterium RIFCSPLOWO2_02_FULL_48_12 TaxID=1802407 RepID=A0A1F7VB49_9BACT|nr:MAG: cytidine deaminase [Candidatus Uhrbacteria bacterium RIFCSPLOWO2_02_FULL_48_12]
MPKRANYISWDECFVLMAELIAERSKDPSTQAGAVIVNGQKVIVGLGYNGFPRGVSDEDLPWEREGSFLETKYAYVVHAEENAIYNSNAQTKGCTIYTTLFPCNECAKTIIQNGLSEVVYTSDKYHDEDIWIASRRLFDRAGVTYRQYVPEHKLKLEKPR